MRWLRMLIAVLAAGAVLGGCSHDPGPGPLQAVDVGGRAGGALWVKSDLPYEFPFPSLCTTGSPQRIRSVTPWKPTGPIKVVDWGVHLITPRTGSAGNVGAEQMTVAQVGGFDHEPVSARCVDSKSPTTVQEFYISASTTSKRAVMDGVTLHYGAGRTLNVFFRLALCVNDHRCAPVHLD